MSFCLSFLEAEKFQDKYVSLQNYYGGRFVQAFPVCSTGQKCSCPQFCGRSVVVKLGYVDGDEKDWSNRVMLVAEIKKQDAFYAISSTLSRTEVLKLCTSSGSNRQKLYLGTIKKDNPIDKQSVPTTSTSSKLFEFRLDESSLPASTIAGCDDGGVVSNKYVFAVTVVAPLIEKYKFGEDELMYPAAYFDSPSFKIYLWQRYQSMYQQRARVDFDIAQQRLRDPTIRSALLATARQSFDRAVVTPVDLVVDDVLDLSRSASERATAPRTWLSAQGQAVSDPTAAIIARLHGTSSVLDRALLCIQRHNEALEPSESVAAMAQLTGRDAGKNEQAGPVPEPGKIAEQTHRKDQKSYAAVLTAAGTEQCANTTAAVPNSKNTPSAAVLTSMHRLLGSIPSAITDSTLVLSRRICRSLTGSSKSCVASWSWLFEDSPEFKFFCGLLGDVRRAFREMARPFLLNEFPELPGLKRAAAYLQRSEQWTFTGGDRVLGAHVDHSAARGADVREAISSGGSGTPGPTTVEATDNVGTKCDHLVHMFEDNPTSRGHKRQKLDQTAVDVPASSTRNGSTRPQQDPASEAKALTVVRELISRAGTKDLAEVDLLAERVCSGEHAREVQEKDLHRQANRIRDKEEDILNAAIEIVSKRIQLQKAAASAAVVGTSPEPSGRGKGATRGRRTPPPSPESTTAADRTRTASTARHKRAAGTRRKKGGRLTNRKGQSRGRASTTRRAASRLRRKPVAESSEEEEQKMEDSEEGEMGVASDGEEGGGESEESASLRSVSMDEDSVNGSQ